MEFRSIFHGISCKCRLLLVRTNKSVRLVTLHSSHVHAHTWVMLPPAHTLYLTVSLLILTHQQTQLHAPFCPIPPLVFNPSVNNFYLERREKTWGATNSSNLKFQAREVPCCCCTVLPQTLFSLLIHMRGLTCHDLSFEMEIFIDGTEKF